MNVSVPDADNSYIYAAAQEFKSRVEEYSNGSIELTIYPNGSLVRRRRQCRHLLRG